MPTPQNIKAYAAAAPEVLPAIGKVCKVWPRYITGCEALQQVLDILEREGIATPTAPFSGTRNDDSDDSPIVVKVFSDGQIVTSTPENWGVPGGRSHGFHARVHSGQHAPSDPESKHREGNK